MDIAKLKELLVRIESADGAEATHWAFMEWAQVTHSALPSLIARLEAAEAVVEAGRKLRGTSLVFGKSGAAKIAAVNVEFDTALTTYDQEKARD